MTAQASLQEIRDAYKQKAKRYHPDAGGRGMVVSHPGAGLRDAQLGARRPRHARSNPPAATSSRAASQAASGHRVGPCRNSRHRRRTRLVWSASSSSACAISGTTPSISGSPSARPDEDRFLSCNLNLSWPDQGVAERAETIQRSGGDPGDAARRLRPDDHHRRGWSHRGRARTKTALPAGCPIPTSTVPGNPSTRCTSCLRARGLGLRQWSRDLFIPRGWR